MKVGDVFETAMCKNCGLPVVHTYWGNGGTIWTHENGDWDCYETPHAVPAAGTIDKVID